MSFVVAHAICWWLTVHAAGDAFVVSSAPTHRQVRAILWREITRAHRRHQLPGRVNQTEWWIGHEMVGFGAKPSDTDPAAFQGIHADLWDAADTLIANEASRIVAIGNPTDPQTRFAEVCRPGSGWHVRSIDAFETPNFTNEPVAPVLRDLLIGPTWVEEKRRTWGEDSPLWISHVRGQFPEQADDGLLRIAWVRAAQERDLVPSDPNELGVYVAGGGRNATVIAHRRGPVVRIVHHAHEPDTMRTVGRIVQIRREVGATAIKVDMIGIGHGVVTRLQELGEPVIGINVGGRAHDPERFLNRRAEIAWGVRERAEAGDLDLDPQDDDLAAELLSLRVAPNSRGQTQLESKASLADRGYASFDRADALMLAFAAITRLPVGQVTAAEVLALEPGDESPAWEAPRF